MDGNVEKAVRILADAHARWKGVDAYDLSARLGIPIFRDAKMADYRALIVVDKRAAGGYRIVLPSPRARDATAREGLLCYHELAHWFLFKGHPLLSPGPYWSRRPYEREVEGWCDAFAVAMLASFFGRVPYGAGEADGFFRAGESLERPGNRGDLFLGYRLLRIARGRRLRGALPDAPLRALAREIIANASE